MRILILTWRDIKNPLSGGAETLTHELARRWAARGHPVMMFTSQFANGKREESVDGIRIIRRGTWWTVQIHALFHYFSHANLYDVVIDEVHWFPFFSVLYARKKTVLLACEVARNLYPVVFPFPLSLFWRVIERFYLFAYRTVPTMAISRSTRDDLIVEGFDARRITVIPMGVTIPSRLPHVEKEKNPTFIYLGRINKQKGMEDTLRAFQLIHKKLPKSFLWVVGTGEPHHEAKMKQLAWMLGVTAAVRFFGRVAEAEKFRLLARSHLLLFPSLHEGWGLVASEAGLVGTPTVGYNSAGIRDVVRNGKSGILVDPEPAQLSAAVIHVIRQPKLLQALQAGAGEEAKRHDWDDTAREAFRVLQTI